MPTKIKPSRVRSIGPREAAFMAGSPIGDFHPEPMYLDNVEPLTADVPFTPDWSHTPTVGTVRACETPLNERRRREYRTNLLLKWAVLLTWAAAYVVIGLALWMGER